MRLKLLLIAGLILAALPAAARTWRTMDGQYTICRFREMDDCEVLTEPMLQSDRFSADERRVLQALKALSDAPRTVTMEKLEQAFGKPTVVMDAFPGARDPNEFGASWVTDPKGPCPICGIKVLYQYGALVGTDYSVSDKFIIFWWLPSERTPR